jgi:hypothetical protein
MGKVQFYNDRPCVNCGTSFTPKSSNNKACGPECKAALLKAVQARTKAKLEQERAKSRIVPPAPPQGLAERPADMDDPVKYERDEWSEAQVRKHFHLDGREPAKHRARSLGEAEALQRRER